MIRKGLLKNWILILMVVGLAFTPLFLVKNGEFGGADGQAGEAISEIKPNYEPWFSPLWRPQSTEVEGFLFSLQAALGAGMLGYGLGYLKGRKTKRDDPA